MRVYLAIFAIALLLLLLLGVSARLWVGDYLSTIEFRQTAFVEIGSFILTSAVVGGLSAAVAEYLRQRELQPLRRRAFVRLDQAVRAAVDCLLKIMTEGPDRNDMAFRKGSGGSAMPVIATRSHRVRMPRRAHAGLVKTMWRRINARIADIHRILDRFTVIFSIDRQDDLAIVEQFFDDFRERMNVLEYLLGETTGYRSTTRPEGEVREQYQELRDALVRLAKESKSTSSAAERIDAEIDFLADDLKQVVRVANAMDPDHRSVAGIACSHDVWFDYSTTIEEMEARIVARVPDDAFGNGWISAMSTWDAANAFGSRAVDQWKREFPPPTPPDLRLVE